jgi:hypothetical protein
MDEAMNAVLLDEFRAATGAMLLKSSSQIIGDADVERAVSAAGENVDVIGAGCGMAARTSAQWLWVPAFAGTTSYYHRNKLRTL